jgi:DNA-binding transcriptional MerR regulator
LDYRAALAFHSAVAFPDERRCGPGACIPGHRPGINSRQAFHFEAFGFSIQVWIFSLLSSGLQMGHHQPIRSTSRSSSTPASEIPDKLYFRIGEVARLCEVPAYVLRFWESEFPQLKPNKGGTGQRLYRRRDVEMALRVKSLLKDEGYTIPGARAVLKVEFKQKEPQLSLLGGGPPVADVKQLRGLRRELEAIAAILSRPIGKPAAVKKSPPIQSIRAQRRAASNKAQPGEFSFGTPAADKHPR